MKILVSFFLTLFFSVNLFSQTETVLNTGSLIAVGCPTLLPRSAYDLCSQPTTTITPGVNLPPNNPAINYTWAVPPGAIVLPGSNPKDLVTISGGVFTLTAENDATHCTDQRTYTTIACPVGIEENSEPASLISVYPNPTHGVFELSLDKMATVLIFDMYGTLLSTKHYDPAKHTINISNLVDGVYFLKINTTTFSRTIKILKD